MKEIEDISKKKVNQYQTLNLVIKMAKENTKKADKAEKTKREPSPYNAFMKVI